MNSFDLRLAQETGTAIRRIVIQQTVDAIERELYRAARAGGEIKIFDILARAREDRL